jgi:hypothetical protein
MHAFITSLARAMALLGGLVLTALVVLVCLSIAGRGAVSFAHGDAVETRLAWLSDAILGLGIGPVPGDFEIVEAGIAFAIFAFLPLCQLNSGHATVDIFTSALSGRANAWIKAFWELCLAAVILLITWRLSLGMSDRIESGEITFLLGFPTWWSYAASLLAALVASIVALYCAWARVAEAATGCAILDAGEAR